MNTPETNIVHELKGVGETLQPYLKNPNFYRHAANFLLLGLGLQGLEQESLVTLNNPLFHAGMALAVREAIQTFSDFPPIKTGTTSPHLEQSGEIFHTSVSKH